MKWLLLIALAAGVIFSLKFSFAAAKPSKIVTVTAGKAKFSVEIADTFATRARGLSGHAPLKDDEGMLFIFQTPSSGSFWMHRMLFPLDIVWIAKGKVVGIAANARPMKETGYKLYAPPAPVGLVLEINAGVAKKRGMKIGDAVSYR